MSSYVQKYKIHYDGNDGNSYDEYIYCKFENVWDGQLWANEDGTPVNFGCVTDSHAFVKAMCIAGLETNNKYEYWEQINNFDLPESVAKTFNYKYPQHVKNL
jgi:hypothetical protein